MSGQEFARNAFSKWWGQRTYPVPEEIRGLEKLIAEEFDAATETIRRELDSTRGGQKTFHKTK